MLFFFVHRGGCVDRPQGERFRQKKRTVRDSFMPRRPSGDKEVQHGDLLRAIRRYGLLRDVRPDGGPSWGRLEERKDEKSLSQPWLQWETRGFEPSLTPCHYFTRFVTGRSPMS